MSRRAVDTASAGPVVERALGSGTIVTDVRRLSGGASRETWRVDATAPDGSSRTLVLRREPPGGSRLPGPAVDEFRLVSAAAAAGVPVAAPRAELTDADDLGVGFVMEHVDGATLGRAVVADESLADARSGLARELGSALASIHSIPVDATGLQRHRGADQRGASSHAALQLDQMVQLLDTFESPRPVLEFALRKLRDSLPRPRTPVVVHGDFRVGNLVVSTTGLRAVLDWELAHVGDPAEDLGWLCVRSWRFGGSARVGGVGDVADLLDAYRAAGGAAIGEDELAWWEAFGNLRWAVICMVQSWTHLGGIRRSVELAAIGRRVCEVEYDLMELLT